MMRMAVPLWHLTLTVAVIVSLENHSQAAENSEWSSGEFGEISITLPSVVTPIELTARNFQYEVLDAPVPTLVVFWAEWCAPCKSIAPTIEELAAEYQGTVKVGKINIDEHFALANKYGAEAIPLLLVFKDGKVVDKKVGASNKADIEALIKKAL